MVKAGSYDLSPPENTTNEDKDKKPHKTEGKKTFQLIPEENDTPDAARPESPEDRVKFQDIDDDVFEDEVIHRKLPAIPDGGWGWVVVLAAFMVSACADGLAFSFGLLHEEFNRYFDAKQAETAMIGSLFIATPLLAAPILSALVDWYGCRIMTVIAGITSTLSFLLASFCNTIPLLCLTFGFMAGLSIGVFYVTAVVSVAVWFDKRRNLAVSLASCGVGLGTVLYSPLTHYLLSVYDWRNTIIALAGTLVNMCVCGVLMRNPEWLDIKQKEKRRLSRLSRRSSRASSASSKAESFSMDADQLNALLESGRSPEEILATLEAKVKADEELEANTEMNESSEYKRMHSAIHLPTYIQRRDKVPQEVIDKLMENKKLNNILIMNYPDLIRPESNSALPKSNDRIDKSNVNASGDAKDVPKEEKKESATAPKTTQKATDVVHTWLRQISSDRHYLRDMPLYKNTVMHRGAMMSIPRYKLKASSLPDMYRNSVESLDSLSDDDNWKWYHRIWENTKASFDVKMFSEFHFLMYNLSSLIFSIWFIVPFFFLNSFMKESNMEGEQTMIIIIGVASSIGSAALGWAGDQPWINVTLTYATCMVICGFSIILYPLAISNIYGLGAVSAVFGLSLASSHAYTPVILMELMPIDRFTVAYGLILLSQGVGHLVGPPIGGALYDATGSWDLTFYMAGACIITSGLMTAVIHYTRDRRLCGSAPLLKESEQTENVEFGEIPLH